MPMQTRTDQRRILAAEPGAMASGICIGMSKRLHRAGECSQSPILAAGFRSCQSVPIQTHPGGLPAWWHIFSG